MSGDTRKDQKIDSQQGAGGKGGGPAPTVPSAAETFERGFGVAERSRDRGGTLVFGAMAGLLAAYLVWLVVRGSQALQLGVTNGWIGTGFRLASGVICLIFGLRQRRGSVVPLLFGVALIFTAIGNTILTLDSLHGPPPPPPTPADLFGLSFIVLCFAGIGLMAHEDRQRLSPREVLDAGIAALGAGAVCAAFALGRIPRLPGESNLGSASQLAFAIGFVVLGLIVAGAATVSSGRSRVGWVELTVAFALLAVGSGLGAALGMTTAVRTLTEIQWPLATLLIAAAMWADPGAPDPLTPHRGVAVWIPALACCAAIAVLVAATLTRVDHTAVALAAGALILVMVRGYSELRHEIRTRQRTEKSLRLSEADYGRVAEEQAALRRVATLVAAGTPPSTVFAAVAGEVGRLLAVDAASVGRYHVDNTVEIVAAWSPTGEVIPVGLRRQPVTGTVTATVRDTRRPARVDEYGEDTREAAREVGIRSSVAVPITVEGGLWGLIGVVSTSEEPPPPGTEDRLVGFTELVASAIANAQAREELRTIAHEQTALRRVATLVAAGAPPADVFAAVAEEVGSLLSVEGAFVARYEPGDAVTILAGQSTSDRPLPIGLRTPITAPSLGSVVRETGRPARIDHYADHPVALEYGIRSSAAAPITVQGGLWGYIGVTSTREEPPPGTEVRLAAFTELAATAVANSQAREELRTIADEQAALRRAATLVAETAPPAKVFASVAEEAGRLLHVDRAFVARYEADNDVSIVAAWSSTGATLPVDARGPVEDGSISHLVRETGRAARIDAYHDYPDYPGNLPAAVGMRSAVGVPITVEGRLWGLVAVGSGGEEPPPPDTEARLAGFTEVVATAIANAQAREELRTMADEQAALRRVATLVARGVPAREVFDAVASETKRILEFDTATLLRLETDGMVTVTASVATMPLLTAVGDRRPSLPGGAVDQVLRTGRPARIDGFEGKPGSPGDELNALGYGGAAAAPIFVEGRMWGVVRAGWSKERSVSLGSEDRLLQFSELIATALANAEAREELRQVAEEQAALRRVATLVAAGAPPSAVFASVAEEVGRLLAVDDAAVWRYLPDGFGEILSAWSQTGEPIPVGFRAEPVAGTLSGTVRETKRPARVDRYTDAAGGPAREIGIRSSVGAPIIVEGELWGLIAVVSTSEQRPPPGTEDRLAGFTELVATAIANSQAREELRTIADEQAALGRVATLVAQGEASADVFAAVAEEVGRLLNTDDALVVRFEPDESVTIVASWTATGKPLPLGHRRHVEPGDGLTPVVRQTGRPARIDSQTDYYSELGIESAVAAPITVEGRIWGVVGVALRGPTAAPPNTEERLAGFTELVATAIANAESREQLMASRARIVAAADGARHRIERDLHDGAQQRLVQTMLWLKELQLALDDGSGDAAELVARALETTQSANDELRELARGIHPAILTERGLASAIKTIARRSPLPVTVHLRTDIRLPGRVEVSGYYVVSEALTNAAKHSNASGVQVTVDMINGHLRLSIKDDGVGGADPDRGSGLLGIKDRVEAVGGTLTVESHPGRGTLLVVDVPVTPDTTTSSP